VLDGQLATEEVERVDVQQAERPSGDVVPEHVVAVGRQRLEELEEEQRDDRQVVTAEPARRKPEQETDDRADHDDQRDGDEGREVEAELVRVEECVQVGAEPVD